MLRELVTKTCRKIAALSPERERPAMRAQIDRARPNLMKGRNLPAEFANVIFDSIATLAIGQVQRSASVAEALLHTIGSRAPLEEQVCVAGILAYFVQPNDLIPDNTPGGFGFIDDAILLRAGYEQMFRRPPDGETMSNEEAIGFMSSLIEPSIVKQLDQSVRGLQGLIQFVASLDRYALQMTLEQMVSNPLALPVVTPAQPGFAPRTPGLPPQGRFSGGMYFEGNNVIVPGGPSLIDGKLYIP